MSRGRGLAVRHPAFLCEPNLQQLPGSMEAATVTMPSVELGVNLEPSQGLQNPGSGWDSLP